VSELRFINSIAFLVSVCLMASGRQSDLKPTVKELQLIEAPPGPLSSKVDALAPKAIEWYESVEKQLLPLGRSLTKKELQIAKRLGIERH
jgi:hypothetical protein